MKRSILAILVLAVALVTTGVDRLNVARAGNRINQSDADALGLSGATIDEPQTGQELTEEFHQSYPLGPTGRVSIENINGGVRIAVWDQNEVKVDAVKHAYKRERLDEAKIEVATTADGVRIKTTYPDRSQTFTTREPQRYDNPASVEYTLTIPRKARIDSADLVNGSLDIEGAEGDVKAACVNGNVTARGLSGEIKLSTVNGSVLATIVRIDEEKSTTLNSVNGSIVLTLPASAGAQVKASTVHGAITNDFGLQVNDGEYVGHDLSGQIGNGGPRIRLNNVNGSIAIKRG
jgi:DUF4097 and DUF4098 domain-containing protein YvlB